MSDDKQVAVQVQRLALWAALMQGLVGISWIAYVAYLPRLLEMVGISAQRALWILLADQILFVLFDWIAGSQADRIARVRGRVCKWLAVVAALSALLLLLLPWAAATGSALVFLTVSLLWTMSSSVMRAPVLGMLGRLGTPQAKSKVISYALAGLGLAGAFAPFLGGLFKEFSPYWPMAVTAVTMMIASAFAVWIEPRQLAVSAGDVKAEMNATSSSHKWPLPLQPSRELAWIAGLMMVAGSGMQLLTGEIGGSTFKQMGAVPLMLWLPIFWASFFIAQPWCKRLIDRTHERRASFIYPAMALLVAALALLLGRYSGQLAVFALSQAIAGAAWGLMLASALTYATQVAAPSNAGAASGIVFAMLATGNVFRLTLTAAGVDIMASLHWWPALVWIVAAVMMLVWTLVRRSATP